MADFDFRPITTNDIPMLHRWRNLPHVSQWWTPQNPSYQAAQEEYRHYIAPHTGVQAFMILHKGIALGYIQKWQVAKFPDYKPYVDFLEDSMLGVDVFIGPPDQLHKGLGTAAMRQFLRVQVFDDSAVPACIIDPLPSNAAAIRAYEKVGFQHRATFTHDNTPVYFMVLPRARFFSP